MKNQANLQVVVRDRELTLFEGQAWAVSGKNEIGPFDILNQHANFVTIISGLVILHLSREKKKEIEVKMGILRVKANQVGIYLGL